MAFKITDACVKCGSCADQCPVEAISEGDDFYVIDADVCVSCVQTPTTIGFDTENAILPAGKYIVKYSFEGTGDAAGTVEITPFYNGAVQELSARSDVLTDTDLQANVDGVFAFTTPAGTNLSFVATLTGATTTLTDVLFSLVIQKMS